MVDVLPRESPQFSCFESGNLLQRYDHQGFEAHLIGDVVRGVEKDEEPGSPGRGRRDMSARLAVFSFLESLILGYKEPLKRR